MSVSVVVPFVMSAFVIVTCQQPLENLREISPYLPSAENLEKNLLLQCETFAQNLSEENERLKKEVRIWKLKAEALEDLAIDEDDDEEEEDEDDSQLSSYEGGRPSRAYRKKRGAGCEGGTLSAWACAPQCIFKLKGLCGLSLKSICHC